jgi:hypothetical protein
LLFLGLHQDISELQEELREITAGDADAMTIAPCFYGRLNVIMKERVEAIANGGPLIVEVSQYFFFMLCHETDIP